jgi:hypothetical protein
LFCFLAAGGFPRARFPLRGFIFFKKFEKWSVDSIVAFLTKPQTEPGDIEYCHVNWYYIGNIGRTIKA